MRFDPCAHDHALLTRRQRMRVQSGDGCPASRSLRTRRSSIQTFACTGCRVTAGSCGPDLEIERAAANRHDRHAFSSSPPEGPLRALEIVEAVVVVPAETLRAPGNAEVVLPDVERPERVGHDDCRHERPTGGTALEEPQRLRLLSLAVGEQSQSTRMRTSRTSGLSPARATELRASTPPSGRAARPSGSPPAPRWPASARPLIRVPANRTIHRSHPAQPTMPSSAS